MLYFAYGPNMVPEAFATRCPSGRFVALGWLPDRRIVYDRIFRDVPGPDLAPAPGERVWGVVYDISDEDMAALDVYERCNPTNPSPADSYRRVTLDVATDQGPIPAEVYVALNPSGNYKPLPEHLDALVAAARYWKLPDEYAEQLEKRLR